MPKAKTPRNGNSTKLVVSASAAAIATGQDNNVAPGAIEDEIRRRAYELYEQRGCMPGREDEDWLLAEQEVAARHHHAGA